MMGAWAPKTATPVERRLDALAARRLDALPVNLPLAAWRGSHLPNAWLPVLAWALHVWWWESGWTASAQRRAISAARDIHRAGGTVAGVRGALASIGAIFDYAEGPAAFTFRVTLYNVALIPGGVAHVRSVLDRVKRASAHYTLHTGSAAVGASVYLAAGVAGSTVGPAQEAVIHDGS